MIDLDFIEIGSSDHDTLLDGAPIDIKGIIIEPVKIYLDRLPNLPNVKKINVAISPDNKEEMVDVYYVPPEIIENNSKYHLTLKGCNRIGEMHKQHILWGMQEYVQSIKVPMVPLYKILKENNVKQIEHLKIDIEGGDSLLLLNFLEYLKNKTKEYYPKKITFETNELTDQNFVSFVIGEYNKLEYQMIERGDNTVLIKT
jgi:FkbM family methyltransferase